MKKKIVLISGGSSGIGKHIVKNLLKDNFYVINLTRKRTYLKSGNYENYIIKNFDNKSDLKVFFHFIKKKYKEIYAIINNAGSSFEGYGSSNFIKNININLSFSFHITSLFINILRKKGKIINISSIASMVSLPNNPGYNASKAALNSLTRSFAIDYAHNKINVNSLVLGYFPTKMTSKSYKSKSRNNKIKRNTILKRWGNVKEIYGPVEFLLSDRSNYITGQSIIVDGGWTIKGMK